eukprot:1788653-Prymnesium_polylepis.1
MYTVARRLRIRLSICCNRRMLACDATSGSRALCPMPAFVRPVSIIPFSGLRVSRVMLPRRPSWGPARFHWRPLGRKWGTSRRACCTCDGARAG